MLLKKGHIGLKTILLFATSYFAFANISGTVYKDFNSNGVKDSGDVPIVGASVKATCSDGNTTTAITDSNGNYTLSDFLSGSKCRIEADVSSVGLGDGINSHGASPLVDIVEDGAVHNISTSSSAIYCQSNPDVVVAALPGYFTNGNCCQNGGKTPIGHGYGSVFKVPAPHNGEFNVDSTIDEKRTILATVDETGSIWGAAYQKSTKTLFVSAVLKRYIPLKDESSIDRVKRSAGAIYKVDTLNGGATLFTTIPDVLTEEAASDLSDRNYSINKDLDIIKYTGRMGLGDLEISEDGKTLYTINMKNKQLVKIDIATKVATTVDITNPYGDDCEDSKVRPWALKVRGKDVYIGSVCENRVEDDIGAVIQKYNGDSFSVFARTTSLSYLRARIYSPKDKEEGDGYRYVNWDSNSADAPILTDIEFTNRDDLVLGYNSRATFNRYSLLRGDIRKMCLNSDGTYTDEKSDKNPNSTCKTHEVHYDGNPTTYYEFYRGDSYGINYGEIAHPESANGALAQVPGAPNIIVGMMDATDWYQPGAVGNYDNKSGDKIGAQAIIKHDRVEDGGEREVYSSKAGGMGDVELLCDSAPIEIGDYVWIDIDQDGIQDPSEPPFRDVNVMLQCKEGGSYVDYGRATTDEKGHYYFGGKSNANLVSGKVLVANIDCRLSIDKSDVNNKDATIKDVNGNRKDTIDNDAKASGNSNIIEFTTTTNNNHNLDFGILPAIGCLTGVLYEDQDSNKEQSSSEPVAPAGITVKATDAFGNVYTTQTDENGTYLFSNILAGKVTVTIDVTDTDIPEGVKWTNKILSGNIDEGVAPTCLEKKFPYTLLAPIDQDPKDSATCANPTSFTWKGANVSTATEWQNLLTTDLVNVSTVGGDSVSVTMHIDNPNGKFYDTNGSLGSGTNATFGQPYLTLYLGKQEVHGDGNWQNSDRQGCSAHGYELESGQKAILTVEFDQEVILDNWRILDIDSGNIRDGETGWEWQDGIKVEGFDANNNLVKIETKIGDSGRGLIVDSNKIVHTDKDHYDAGDGDFSLGEGTNLNATKGHIVLTSNFKPIKKLVITHLAGPDMPCQTHSSLALSGFAVCKPLHIKGRVFNDKDGAYKPTENPKCTTQGRDIDGDGIGVIDGTPLNVCLLDEKNKVIDRQNVALDGTYDFYSGIQPKLNYKILLTKESCVVGKLAPNASLPNGWNYEAEATISGIDEQTNGIIKLSNVDSDYEGINFAINKNPEVNDFDKGFQINPNGTIKVQYTTDNNFTFDNEEAPAVPKIVIDGVSGGILYYNGLVKTVGDEISSVDFSNFKIDPNDGDIVVGSFRYHAIDSACRESNEAIFKATFRTVKIGGKVYKDMTRDNTVNGTPAPKSCDGNTQLYAVLLDSNNTKLASKKIAEDGSYLFYSSDGVHINSSYTIVLTDNQNLTQAHLPIGCSNLDGEHIGSNSGTDGTPDGKISVNVEQADVEDVNFAIAPMAKEDRVLITDRREIDLSAPVTIDVLSNDRGDFNRSSVEIELLDGFMDKHPDAKFSADKKRLVVPGEGRWSVNPDGTITYEAEDKENPVNPTPIAYSVADKNGKRYDKVSIILIHHKTCCKEYKEDSVGIYKDGSLALLILLSSMLGLFFVREEKL